MIYKDNRKKICLFFTITGLICVGYQFLIGGRPELLLIVSASIILVQAVILTLKLNDIKLWMFIIFFIGNIFAALLYKTYLGQGIGSNLLVPQKSFILILVTLIVIALAIHTTNAIKIRKHIFKEEDDVSYLNYISYTSFCIGLIFNIIGFNISVNSTIPTGLGGVGVFSNLVIFGIITRTIFYIKSGKRYDRALALMITISTLIGFISNKKEGTFLPILSYVITYIIQTGYIRKKTLIIYLPIFAILFYFLTPIIHIYRSYDLQKLKFLDRINVIIDKSTEIMPYHSFYTYESNINGYSYTNYFGETSGNSIIGRYSSVQQIDPVIYKADMTGSLGIGILYPELLRILPRIIYSNKDQTDQSFYILLHYGYLQYDSGRNPTLPLIGELYSACKLFGVCVLGFLVFLIYFILLDIWVGGLKDNPFAIFIICTYMIIFSSQGNITQYISFPTRTCFIYFIAIFIMKMIYKFLLMPKVVNS